MTSKHTYTTSQTSSALFLEVPIILFHLSSQLRPVDSPSKLSESCFSCGQSHPPYLFKEMTQKFCVYPHTKALRKDPLLQQCHDAAKGFQILTHRVSVSTQQAWPNPKDDGSQPKGWWFPTQRMVVKDRILRPTKVAHV